jgi:hypothetical protein
MHWLVFGLFLFGLLLGWLLRDRWAVGRLERDLITSQAEAKKFDQFAAEMAQTDSLLAASTALTDLDLLARLEEQRYGDVSALLIHKLGLFYHYWNSKPESAARSEHIQNALAQIREAAKEFKSVEAVLTYKPDNERPAA